MTDAGFERFFLSKLAWSRKSLVNLKGTDLEIDR